MAKIKAPNADYNGVSASLTFVKGEAETEDKWLIEWFKNNGYEVDNSEAEKKAEEERLLAEKKAAEEAEKVKLEAEAKAKAEEEALAIAESKKKSKADKKDGE